MTVTPSSFRTTPRVTQEKTRSRHQGAPMAPWLVCSTQPSGLQVFSAHGCHSCLRLGGTAYHLHRGEVRTIDLIVALRHMSGQLQKVMSDASRAVRCSTGFLEPLCVPPSRRPPPALGRYGSL